MLIGILCVTGVVALWSVTSILVKIALRFLDPYTLAFLRLVQGMVIFLLLYAPRFRRKRRDTADHSDQRILSVGKWWIAAGGIGLAVNYICFIVALKYTTAGAGGLVVQIQFVALAVLASIVLKERLRLPKIGGIAAVVAGVLVIFSATGGLSDAVRSEFALGNGVMLVAGIGWGTYALSNKALSNRLSNIEILVPVFAIALAISAVFVPFTFELKAPVTFQAVFAVTALGIGSTGVGFLLMSEGLRRLSGALVGTLTAATPLFTLIFANLILDEPIRPLMIVSAFLIGLGVVTIAITERRESRLAGK